MKKYLKPIVIVFVLLFAADYALPQEILEALNNNDPERAKALILENPEIVNTKDEYDVTPAHLAVLHGYADLLKLILEKGADVNSRDSDGQSPLFWAAGSGTEEIVDILLEHGAEVDSKDDMMRTPFFYAQSSNNMAIIRKLISLGAEINIVDKNGGSPLLFALEKFCDQKIVNLLLEEGTTVNVEGEQGRILLHKAAAGGYVNLVVILLDKGADILTNNKTGGTLLHSAAAGGLTELVSNLLDSGFHIDSVDELNRTPLHIAEDRGNSDTEELLKERGAADIPRKTFSLDDRDKAANRSNAEYLKTEQVEVSYIANSGFLVKCGDKKILIDAMHRYFYYMPTPSASLAKMNNSQPPFDNIDVLLITHPDADHFDPAMILTFLSLNPDTKMIGSTLTCDKLREYDEGQYEKIKSQIIEADLDFGSSADFSVSGIGIKALGLDHGGNYLNLGFVIDLNETKLIHLGDMSPAASMKYFENFQLREENIDIAFSSYAFGFDTGYQKILSDYIHPKYNIAMHIQSDLVERVEREFKGKFPNTIVFRETMQKIIFRK